MTCHVWESITFWRIVALTLLLLAISAIVATHGVAESIGIMMIAGIIAVILAFLGTAEDRDDGTRK